MDIYGVDFETLSAQCAPGVAVQTMSAIVKTESGGNPFAIGVNRGAALTRQPTDYASAVVVARELIARGANIDLGLGQINIRNLKWLGLTVEQVLEPCTNLAAAARILQTNYSKALREAPNDPLHAALSAYNTGNFRTGIANGYVAKVVRNSR